MKTFKVNEDIIMWAFRYALGRRTGAVQSVVDCLQIYWKELEPFTQTQIEKEIIDAIEQDRAGDHCDIMNWQKFLSCPNQLTGSEKRIKSPAILQNDIIYIGKNHAEIIMKIVVGTGVKPVLGEQGFITNANKFVDRHEAAVIAYMARQIPIQKNELFSEDLPVWGKDGFDCQNCYWKHGEGYCDDCVEGSKWGAKNEL